MLSLFTTNSAIVQCWMVIVIVAHPMSIDRRCGCLLLPLPQIIYSISSTADSLILCSLLLPSSLLTPPPANLQLTRHNPRWQAIKQTAKCIEIHSSGHIYGLSRHSISIKCPATHLQIKMVATTRGRVLQNKLLYIDSLPIALTTIDLTFCLIHQWLMSTENFPSTPYFSVLFNNEKGTISSYSTFPHINV